MAQVSTMMALGTAAPPFHLPNVVDGTTVSIEQFDKARALLVMFVCNHCPYVQHVRDEIGRIARDYQPRGVALVAINSNSLATHPHDGPEHMKAMAESLGWRFPFLFDESQFVAKAYQAACTPEFYLFGPDKRLVYRGQLDDSRPGNGLPVTGKDLREALDAVLAGRAVSPLQKPSIGCSIKWNPGAAPDYAR